MFDEYFRRKDVLEFIQELQSNQKYLQKVVHKESRYGQLMGNELALYLFYDSIFKYKILIDDESLFEEYLSQVQKLYRKIVDYDDMVKGIHKLLVNLCVVSLDIRDIESVEGRERIIKHFYKKYITDGYFIHGFSTTYVEFMKGRSFIPEKYPNHYHKMIKVQQILSKYKLSIMNKDFHGEEVFLTDDLIMGCYYSETSPGYFFQFLTNQGVERDLYLKQNYHALISSLKRFMSSHSFGLKDQRTILKIVEEEWNFITRVPKKTSLLLIKRDKVIDYQNDKLEDYLNSNHGLYTVIDKMLSPKYSNIGMQRALRYGEYQIISLPDFYITSMVSERSVKSASLERPYELLNSYGVVSICLILGSFFITLGVIISIIMILRGM